MAKINKAHDVSGFCAGPRLSFATYDGDKHLVMATDCAAIVTVPASGKPAASFPLDPKKLSRLNAKRVDASGFIGKPIAGSEPNWQRLFEGRPKPACYVGIAPEMLRRLADHAEDCEAETVYLGVPSGDRDGIVSSPISFFYPIGDDKVEGAEERPLVSGFVAPMNVEKRQVHENRVAKAFDLLRNVPNGHSAPKAAPKIVKKPTTDTPIPKGEPEKLVKTPPKPTASKPKRSGGSETKEIKAVGKFLREASLYHSFKEKAKMVKALNAAESIATLPSTKKAVADRRKLLKG